jgi:hypothetical protein
MINLMQFAKGILDALKIAFVNLSLESYIATEFIFVESCFRLRQSLNVCSKSRRKNADGH